jgi:branched-subunit amino acid transport protein
MPLSDFLVILAGSAILMLICRVAPMVALKGRELPPTVVRALGFIPPAAFAALVANDLFQPAAFSGGDPWAWATPLLAALAVAVVGVKTKSMAWCIVVGVAAYGLLSWLPQLI